MANQETRITPLEALKKYPGSFECHITVKSDSEVKTEKFERFCYKYDLKPLVIKFDSGATPEHPMLSKVYHGKEVLIWKEIQTVIQKLKAENFEVHRLKIEAGFNNTNIPESEAEIFQLNEMNYFEFHVKLELPLGYNLDPLRLEVKKYDGHLSSNALWKTETTLFHFVTQRVKNCGKTEAEEQLTKLLDYLKSKGIYILKIVREFNIYDSNLSLDDGWIQ